MSATWDDMVRQRDEAERKKGGLLAGKNNRGVQHTKIHFCFFLAGLGVGGLLSGAVFSSGCLDKVRVLKMLGRVGCRFVSACGDGGDTSWAILVFSVEPSSMVMSVPPVGGPPASSMPLLLPSLLPLPQAGRSAHRGAGSSSLTMPSTLSLHSRVVSTLTPSFLQQSFPLSPTTTSYNIRSSRFRYRTCISSNLFLLQLGSSTAIPAP